MTTGVASYLFLSGFNDDFGEYGESWFHSDSHDFTLFLIFKVQRIDIEILTVPKPPTHSYMSKL